MPHLGGADPDVEARLFVLSEPERDVFLLVGRGLTNTEIAQSIHLSESTVKAQFGRLLDQLDLDALFGQHQPDLAREGRQGGVIQALSSAVDGALKAPDMLTLAGGSAWRWELWLLTDPMRRKRPI